MRVLLLNPPAEGGQSRDGRCQTEGAAWLSAFPPTTLAGIAGCVREKHDVKVMDCIGSGMMYPDAEQKAVEYDPDFIVLNTSTPTIESDLTLAEAIKNKTGSEIIAYGENVTVRHKSLLRDTALDYAVLGEPETPIMNILAGDSKSPGVATEEWVGGLWVEPNLDDLPFPAYDLLPPYYYPLTDERWMFVRTGRGCPYKCVYCVEPLISPRPRVHSLEYLIRQFKWLIDDLDIRVFMFWEEVATFNKQHMISVCRAMIDEGLNKKCKWFCTTRVDRFDDELAKHMSEAGCKIITFGFESGNQEVLDLNKKGITLEQSRNAVLTAKKYGILTIGHFIIGLIGDTPERARQTAKFSRELKLDFAQFYTATPFPGSEFYKLAIANGWMMEKDLGMLQQGIAAVSYPDFTSKQVQNERKNAFLRFYLRPSAIYSSLKARSPSNVIKLPLQAVRFSTWAIK